MTVFPRRMAVKFFGLLLLLPLVLSGCGPTLPPATVAGHVFRSGYLGADRIAVDPAFQYLGSGVRTLQKQNGFAPLGKFSEFTNRVSLFAKDAAGDPELAVIVTEMDDSGYLNPIGRLDGDQVLAKGRIKDNRTFRFLTFVVPEGSDPAARGRCRMTRWVNTLVQPLNRTRVSLVYSEEVPTAEGAGEACAGWQERQELSADQERQLASFEQRAEASFRVIR